MASPRMSTELRARGRDSAALVKRIANGDESAFATLYDTTCGLIYGLSLRILGNSAVAEQVMAAIYQEVWEQAANYDEREKPMTWLVTMTHRRAVARLRADMCNQPCQPSLDVAGHTLPTGSKATVIFRPSQGEAMRLALQQTSTARITGRVVK